MRKRQKTLRQTQSILQIEVKNMPKKTNAWIEKAFNQAKQQQKQRMKEAGIDVDISLLRLKIGETQVEIDETKMPRTVTTKFGEREVLRVTVNGKVHDWMINPASSLWLDILEQLNAGKTKITVVRSGTGRATRYDLKA